MGPFFPKKSRDRKHSATFREANKGITDQQGLQVLEAASVHLLWRDIQTIFQCFPYPEPKHILFVIKQCENFSVCWDARELFGSSFI